MPLVLNAICGMTILGPLACGESNAVSVCIAVTWWRNVTDGLDTEYRRGGTRFICDLTGYFRVLTFLVNTEESALLCAGTPQHGTAEDGPSSGRDDGKASGSAQEERPRRRISRDAETRQRDVQKVRTNWVAAIITSPFGSQLHSRATVICVSHFVSKLRCFI